MPARLHPWVSHDSVWRQYGHCGQYPLSLHLMSCGKHARLLAYHRPNTQWVVDVMAICALLRKYISLSLTLAPPGLVLGLHMLQWYTPSTGPRPWSMGTGSSSILFTDYSWVEGRQSSGRSTLSISEAFNYSLSALFTTWHSNLQPSISPRDREWSRSSELLLSPHLTWDRLNIRLRLGGRVKKFSLHLIHWLCLTSGIWWYVIVVMWWWRVTGWWHPSHTIHNAS